MSLIALSLLGVALLLSSCIPEDYPEEVGTQRVIIAYLAGDNSLSSEVQQKIDALSKGFFSLHPPRHYKLLIYADSKNEAPRLFEVMPNSIENLRLIRTYPTQNSASPTIVNQVLTETIAYYPALSYGLILFSHGTGWLPAGGLTNPYATQTDAPTTEASTRSVAIDNDNELELIDFAQSLPLPSGKKWAFILFENCYMGSVEVAYELRHKTHILIASAAEIVSPGMTDVYRTSLPLLYRPGSAGTEAFARAYFDHWNGKSGDYQSATISVVNTEKLDELASVARTALSHQTPTDTLPIGTLQCFNRNRWRLFFDLREVLLTVHPSVQAPLDTVLAQVVTYQASTPYFLEHQPHGYAISRHCGLTLYIEQKEYSLLNDAFRKLSWVTSVAETNAEVL